MASIDHNDVKIHYSLQGSGRTIVLLHGFLESHAVWKYFTRKLGSDFSVLAVDLPGHGRSGLSAKIQTMELMAGAVHSVLKELKIATCLMVGHSMGGYVALAFAERYPRKLRGLTLFHSHAAADTAEVRANRERTIRLVEQDRQGFIRKFIPELFDRENLAKFREEVGEVQDLAGSTSREGMVAALEGMKVRPDRTHVLAGAEVPVQFIIGRNDSRIPLQLVMPQTLLPPHSETLLLDHVGHMGFIEARETTVEAIRHFALRVF